MHRIDTADNTDTLPAPTAPGPNPDGYFRKPDPIGGVKGTILDAEWMNMVQEEIANAIEGYGLTLDKADRTQLSQVIGQKQVAFSATQSGTPQTFSNSIYTKVNYNSKLFDTNNNYDESVNYRFTPTIPGIYFVRAHVYFAIAGAEYSHAVLDLRKNGTTGIAHGVYEAQSWNRAEAISLVEMNGTTDYIEVYAINHYNQLLTLAGGIQNSSFFGIKVN